MKTPTKKEMRDAVYYALAVDANPPKGSEAYILIDLARCYLLAYEEMHRIQNSLRICAARAGNPDAAEGCRLVIKTVKEALNER